MKVIVADDEAPARRALARMLGTLGAELVAEAENGLDVLEAVGRTRPDVILLDIEMPEMDGLELAARYASLPPIIFVTAHDAHALRGFEVGAVDYLLKPVALDRLATALHRASVRAERASQAFPRVQKPGPEPRTPRVVTHERGSIRFFDATTIDRFRASEKYTLFTVEGVEHLTNESLGALEQRLREFGFVRAHRSELIRVAAVRSLTQDADGYRAELASGAVVEVSRRLIASVKEALGLR
jgi:two-component system, LytTR family, response regulator